jgi:hypothetical protein
VRASTRLGGSGYWLIGSEVVIARYLQQNLYGYQEARMFSMNEQPA